MTHSWPVRVYYEDTDLAGIVYYANYLKFIERARSEMVREAGIDQVAMKAEGRVFAVARVEADYVAPARFDDTLLVETSLAETTPARFTMLQVVKRGDALIFKAKVTVVCLGPTGRPVRLPDAITKLASLR
jgi:acyl-CoA thioester hydrolase